MLEAVRFRNWNWLCMSVHPTLLKDLELTWCCVRVWKIRKIITSLEVNSTTSLGTCLVVEGDGKSKLSGQIPGLKVLSRGRPAWVALTYKDLGEMGLCLTVEQPPKALMMTCPLQPILQCAGYFLSPEHKQNHQEERNLNWRIVTTRSTYKQGCGGISRLIIDVGGPCPLWPTNFGQCWVVKESRLSKLWGQSQ